MGLIAPNFTLLKYDAFGGGSTVSPEAIGTSLDDGSRDTEVQASLNDAVGGGSTVSPATAGNAVLASITASVHSLRSQIPNKPSVSPDTAGTLLLVSIPASVRSVRSTFLP